MRTPPLSLPTFAITVALLASATAVPAALTTANCLAQKQKAWGGFRKCEAGERAKLLQSKPADLAKCQTRFQDKLTELNEKATDAAIACRYGDNGDATMTDYDTGLQWEKKDGAGDGANAANPHDVDNTYSWLEFIKTDGTGFLDRLNCESVDGTTTSAGFAGHCDWRLPTIAELQAIMDTGQGDCGGGSGACINPIFGPTAANDYWSSTTDTNFPVKAWFVYFAHGEVSVDGKFDSLYVRAVRGGL